MGYLELLAKALNMPRPPERSPYELERNKKELATDKGRPMDSTSKESPKEEEASKAESKEESVDIHEHYHNNPSKHVGCCGFTQCKATYDNDIYILTGKKTTTTHHG
tara:strand:- start:224 stop:544 length:321 start_codon:yes stop_codon:yes gene_type:complete